MRAHLLLGLGFLLSRAVAQPFDAIPEPNSFDGFTVTVEYAPTSKDIEVVRRFYEEIIEGRPDLTYYKTTETELGDDKLPAVIVRCNDDIVYDSYGRTPPRFVWDLAISYFDYVLEKESEECNSQISNPGLTP